MQPQESRKVFQTKHHQLNSLLRVRKLVQKFSTPIGPPNSFSYGYIAISSIDDQVFRATYH